MISLFGTDFGKPFEIVWKRFRGAAWIVYGNRCIAKRDQAKAHGNSMVVIGVNFS